MNTEIVKTFGDVANAPFVKEMRETTANMYRLGWDERNGGNISMMLNESELSKYLDVNKVIRTIPIGFNAKELIGKYFIVTGTGKYFKNVDKDPETNLGMAKTVKRLNFYGVMPTVANSLANYLRTL